MIDLKNPRTFSRPPELTAQISSQALIGHNTVGLYFNCTLKELLRPSVYDFSFWHTGWQMIFFFPSLLLKWHFHLVFSPSDCLLVSCPQPIFCSGVQVHSPPFIPGKENVAFLLQIWLFSLICFKKTFSLSVAICWLEDNAGFISPEALEGDLGCKSN